VRRSEGSEWRELFIASSCDSLPNAAPCAKPTSYSLVIPFHSIPRLTLFTICFTHRSLGVWESGPLLLVYGVFLLIVGLSPTVNKNCCRSRRKNVPDKKKSFVLVRLETQALQKQMAAERRKLIENGKKKRLLEYDDEETGKRPARAMERDIVDDIYHYGTLTDSEGEEGEGEEASQEDSFFVGRRRGKEDEATWWKRAVRDAWEGFDDEEEDEFDFFEEDAGIPTVGDGGYGNSLKVSGFLLRLPMLVIPRSSMKSGSGLLRAIMTFLMSFVVVSYFSFVLTTVISHLALLTPLSAPFYGTAVVSIGAEIPDLIQCSTVARRGYGSMAVSNVLGSQVINICLGLGGPWFISALYGDPVKFRNKGAKRDLNAAAAVLAICVAIFAIFTLGQSAVSGAKPRLGKGIGWVLSACYVVGMGSFMFWYFVYNL
jgi:Ca2+/Na+ antiporter